MRSLDHRLRLGHGREVAKRPLAVLDVVVDRLRDADHGDRQLSPRDFLGDRVGAALRAVAADAEQDVDARLRQKIDRVPRVVRAARRAEHRAAVMLDVADDFAR